MIITSRKLYKKYKAHQDSNPASASTDSLALSDTSTDPRQSLEVPVPEVCPAPFPSPSPAMQELDLEEFGLSLVLPSPPPSPPPEYSDVVDFAFEHPEGEEGVVGGSRGESRSWESGGEGGLTRTVTAIYSPESGADVRAGRRGSLSDTDLTRTSTVVRRTSPPAPLITAMPMQEKYPFDSPSTSQCPTPRPQSVIGMRFPQSPISERFPQSPTYDLQRQRGQSPVSSQSHSNWSPQSTTDVWTASLADRTRPQSQQFSPTPLEIPVHGKWVWVPDASSASETPDIFSPANSAVAGIPPTPPSSYRSWGSSSIAGDIAMSPQSARRSVEVACGPVAAKLGLCGQREPARFELPADGSKKDSTLLDGNQDMKYGGKCQSSEEIEAKNHEALKRQYETWTQRKASQKAKWVEVSPESPDVSPTMADKVGVPKHESVIDRIAPAELAGDALVAGGIGGAVTHGAGPTPPIAPT